jgi:Glycosyltransferase family 87
VTGDAISPPGAVRVVSDFAGQMRALAVSIGILGVLSVWYQVNYVVARLAEGAQTFGDFPALWSYGRIQVIRSAALLYDFDGLHAAQVALGMEEMWQYPFPYPPHVLFLVRPFGFMSYETALGVWIGAQLVFYLWAVLGNDGSQVERFSRNWPVRLAMSAALVVAPTATLTVVIGQSGFLAAGLLIGGMRRAGARPVLAGILLGLLTYKPQLGLLVPVALLAAGWWRCAVSACLTIVVLVLASSAAFGWDIWLVWLRSLAGYQEWFSHRTMGASLRPTVTDNLGILGAPLIVARVAQWAVAAAAAVASWRCFRGGCQTLAIAALAAATCLANPHAHVYDLPMLDAAVVLLVAQRLKNGAGFRIGELLLLAAVLLFPVSMAITTMPFGTMILGTFLAMLMTLQSRQRSRINRSRIDPAEQSGSALSDPGGVLSTGGIRA